MVLRDFVVVDASVAFRWLVEEENSDKATALTRLWDDKGTQPIAPPIMPFAVANVLHRRVVRGDIGLEVALDSLGRWIFMSPLLAFTDKEPGRNIEGRADLTRVHVI